MNEEELEKQIRIKKKLLSDYKRIKKSHPSGFGRGLKTR